MSETIDIIFAPQIRKELQETIGLLETTEKGILDNAVAVSKLSGAYKGVKLPSQFVKINKELATVSKSYATSQAKVAKAEEKVTRARTKAIKKTVAQREASRVKLAQDKLEFRASTNLFGAYSKLSAKLTLLRKEYKNLEARQLAGEKLTKREIKQKERLYQQTIKLDKGLKRIDRTVGQNQRNVGNYSSALKGLGRTFRSLAGALGLTSAVFLFVDGIRDAANRVREFDKAMQNLAGVFRTTRDDLKPLEETIISVAGSTVRTSNEVANLAETLATLGKSPEQIQKLLKPVIDLSLGLNTAADEAGEFLVQMLNAFGEGDEEAAKYADTIATIRTSTTLDFQKMRDSFQYIAPISRILGKDLAYTGSVVGILADNSLKAESAGRLLSTAQIKLATQGKTLNDALEEINQAYRDGAEGVEILTIAEDLFGKQAAKVGAILALNTDAIETNAQAIRDNGGALKDLTDQQLESLDAKLKILDSSYEKFILSLENGDGFISTYLKRNIDSLAESFNQLAVSLDKNEGFWGRLRNGLQGFGSVIGQINTLGFAPANKAIDETNSELEELIEKLKNTFVASQKQTDEFIRMHGSLAPLSEAQQKLIQTQKELIELSSGTSNGGLLSGYTDEEIPRTLTIINEEIKAQNALLLETDVADKNLIESIKVKIKVLEAEKNAILGKNESKNEGIRAIEGSIKAYEQEISKLKEERDALATTEESYSDYNEKIGDVQLEIDKLIVKREKQVVAVSNLKKALDDLYKSQEKQRKAALKELEDTDQPQATELDNSNAENAEKKRKENAQQAIEDTQTLKNAFGGLADAIGISQSAFSNLFDAIDDGFKSVTELAQEFGAVLTDVISSQNAAEQERTAIKIENLNRERDVQLENAEGNDREQRRINIAFDKEERRLKNEQLDKDHQTAIFNAGINTIAAVVEALPNIPLSVAVGVIGAAQTAIIAAKKPQYYEKGKSANDPYTGEMVWGEKRPEVKVDKKGNISMATKPTWGYTEKGDTIYPSIDAFQKSLPTDELLNQSVMMNVMTQGQQLTAAQVDRMVNVDVSANIGKQVSDALSKMKMPKQIKPDYYMMARADYRQKKYYSA